MMISRLVFSLLRTVSSSLPKTLPNPGKFPHGPEKGQNGPL
jgi:hypothetical protein